ncbi:CopG-like transcriptional regulator (modular protein) [Candidatus Sulfopaludibacter sp. SbA4]|nr:CopG-like transcriptional regulator (modular protein) [Candidatus Sulfopaludibacter sp. SbA4]
MTVSLPEAMIQEVERVSKEEHRTHSELVREALRRYFYSRFPVVTPTKAELAAVARGRAQIQKGEFVTLDELLNGLDAENRKASRKGAAKTPRS